MKIRKGFVSNSSSSSFICDVSGEEVIGRDIGLEDAEMFVCINGHTFSEEYFIGDMEESQNISCHNIIINGNAWQIHHELFPDGSFYSLSGDEKIQGLKQLVT